MKHSIPVLALLLPILMGAAPVAAQERANDPLIGCWEVVGNAFIECFRDDGAYMIVYPDGTNGNGRWHRIEDDLIEVEWFENGRDRGGVYITRVTGQRVTFQMQGSQRIQRSRRYYTQEERERAREQAQARRSRR